jgi:5-methylcytosine-specific restriction endonuclease McrA
MKLCTVCGAVARGPRCAKHPGRSGASSPIHGDPRWTRLSRRMIERHVGQYGWVCPGDGPSHPAHPSHDLTADHVVPLVDGGAQFDPGNVRVLCRSRNSELGARLVNARRTIQADHARA